MKIRIGLFTLNIDQKEIIDSISVQCPFASGRAVYEARAIKHMLGDTTVYNDSLACANAQNLRISKPIKNNITYLIKVYPNPSNDFIKIKYILNENQEANFELRDLMGRLLFSCKLNSNLLERKISTVQFPPGFYLYSFKAEGEKPCNGKISIIR